LKYKSIDSVVLIGFADSLGNFENNLELSEVRAKEVMNYLKKIISYKVKFKYNAAGEKNKRIEAKDRRVEVYLYLKENYVDTSTINILIEKTTPKCLTTAYSVLGISHKTIVKKKKQEFVVLELETDHYLYPKVKDLLYYAVIKNDSSIGYSKVKWVKKTSGVDWWAKTRYQFSISKTSFDKYKIFYLSELPCDKCGYNIDDSLATPPPIDTCIMYDALLSYNIQYRTSLFNNKTIEARVPKEYVNLLNEYSYFDKDYNKILWLTKNKRKNSPYYFVTLPLIKEYSKYEPSYRVPKIYKKELCCFELDTFKYRQHCPWFGCCGGVFYGGHIKLGFELGTYHTPNNFIPYLGLGVYKENEKSQYNIMLGFDANANAIGNLRYQYNYATFPLILINPFADWGFNTMAQVNKKYFGRLYVGSALVIGKLENNQRFVNHDLHLGFSIATEDMFFNRWFIQYGLGHNYSKESNTLFTPIFNSGFIFRLF
ncbi:MAG: hypothetical protein JHD28_09820, partial [Bacteroidia bacterium]|nr:hypothetical protein [Bacteroidia bacterium]